MHVAQPDATRLTAPNLVEIGCAVLQRYALKATRSKVRIISYLVVELDQNSGAGPCRILLIQNAYLIFRGVISKKVTFGNSC